MTLYYVQLVGKILGTGAENVRPVYIQKMSPFVMTWFLYNWRPSVTATSNVGRPCPSGLRVARFCRRNVAIIIQKIA